MMTLSDSESAEALTELTRQATLDWVNLGDIEAVVRDLVQRKQTSDPEVFEGTLQIVRCLLESGRFQSVAMDSQAEFGRRSLDEDAETAIARIRKDCGSEGLQGNWFVGLFELKR